MNYNQYPTPTTLKSFRARVNAAQTALDGSSATNLVALITAGTGEIIDVSQIKANASTTTAAGILFFLLCDGTSYRLVLTLQTAAVTLSAANGNASVTSSPNSDNSPIIRMNPSDVLYVGCYNASETWDIHATTGVLS